MALLRSLIVLLTVGSSVASVACVIGEERFEVVHYMKLKQAAGTFTCDSPFQTPDLSKLKECGDKDRGKGHCFDKKKIGFDPAQLMPCEGDDVCIPDKVLEAGGKKVKSCSFAIPGMDAKPGGCASLLIKQVNDFKDQMPKEGCEPDERCGPCINPLDNKPTGICDDGIGVHEKDCVSGAAAKQKSCCHGVGVCMLKENAPPDARDQMSQDACPDANVCVPAAMTSGKVTKCSVLGLDGVCMDLCFASMFQATTPITRSSCQATEMCMPCLLGKSQGMLGCD